MAKKRGKKHTHGIPHAAKAVAVSGLAPPAPRRPTRAQAAAIVAKHAVPLAALWIFGGSTENFLLVSVFTIALTIVGIGCVGVAVTTRQEQGDRGSADAIAALAVLALVGAIGTGLLTAMFGWVIAIVASASPLGLWNAPLGWSALAVLLAAVPQMVMQYRADLAAKLPDAARRRRDQPAVGGLLLCAGLVFVLSGYLGEAGRSGAVVLAILLTMLFIVRDLRPGLFRLAPNGVWSD